ncbi:MarR family winged helix-turn-helix transcriptional regulator [Gordonia neofelifaecis]|uniref:MarR family transcriptional regulator n=1 Tax=Gordonia neofelifaecis NRRL B-59395 TaxID=644548 RepID=F1YI53_9ACTN|nr:MarR family transcriptional regulator [Gordonia neofelifaecis]EGD55607.1 MarR family transcriptional regulator [Gordonia neofelifaecis NRRL B-59395]
MTVPNPSEDRVTGDDGAWALTAVITQLRRSLRSSVREEFAWESLPMAQVEFLQRLAREPGLRIGDLARKHRMANNTVSTLVNQMVRGGLVAREPVPGDKRAVQVRLTQEGRGRLDAWTRANERRISAALAGLDAQQRAAIDAAVPALGVLAERLDEHG